MNHDGTLYAGGEAGQVYRINANGEQTVMGSTDGFLLGIALDGHGAIHACDIKRQAVMRVAADGSVTERSRGTSERPMLVPNYPVFDRAGNLYVSDSGDYWDNTGTGCIYKIDPDDVTTVFHAGPFRFTNGIAIDPTGQWLYIVQSTASNVVRVPLDSNTSDAPAEVIYTLASGTVPDGIAFTADGRLLIACYKPDTIYLGELDGSVGVLCDDPTGELLSRPTNVALHDGRIYIANLGGWHVTSIACDAQPATIHRPV